MSEKYSRAPWKEAGLTRKQMENDHTGEPTIYHTEIDVDSLPTRPVLSAGMQIFLMRSRRVTDRMTWMKMHKDYF